MVKLITFKKITQTTKIARSTLVRRCAALKIKPPRYKTHIAGRPQLAVTSQQLQMIVEFDYNINKSSLYKTTTQLSEHSTNRVFYSVNRELGLYQRLSFYGGTYDARKWEAV